MLKNTAAVGDRQQYFINSGGARITASARPYIGFVIIAIGLKTAVYIRKDDDPAWTTLSLFPR
jgi:hypothetical protein